MALCQGIKRDGGRCTVSVKSGESYCWNHAPERAEVRRRNAAKAGSRARTPHQVRELHALLDETTERVLSGDLKPYPGMVVGQLIGVKIRLLEFEKALREQDELLERLERLEGRGSWAR